MPEHITVSLSIIHHKHVDETWGLCFSPDGKTLLSSDGKALYFWKWEGQSWNYSHSLPGLAHFPCFAPDGKSFAFRDEHNTLQIRSLNGSLVSSLKHAEQAQTDGIFLADGRRFLTFTLSGQLMLWDTQTSRCSLLSNEETQAKEFFSSQWVESHQHVPDYYYLQRTSDDTLLAFTHFRDGDVHIYQFDPAQMLIQKKKTLTTQGGQQLKIAPDDSILALISQGYIRLYKTHDPFRLLTILEGVPENGEYELLAIAPDGHYLAGGTTNGIVDIWSVSSFERVTSFAAHPNLNTRWSDAIGGLDWSETGYIATGGAITLEQTPNIADYTLKFWKVGSRAQHGR